MSALIKAGVIGHPISHSLSPKLHNYWLKKYGINGEYKAYDVAPENLESFIRSMPENGFAGCNVTIPYKERVFELLIQKGELDTMALLLNSVNTILVKNANLHGGSTDAYGFSHNILPHLNKKDKVVILGAGGAATAIWHVLISLGFSEICLTNRTKENLEIKTPILDGMVNRMPHVNYQIYDWDMRSEILENADLLVNTTSLGMIGQSPLDIDLSLLPQTALVTDIVYKPLITPLLAAAKARGNPIVDGLGMLLHQAVPGFEAWFGVKPEVTEELRNIILGA